MPTTKNKHFESMTPGERLAALRDPDPTLVRQITKMHENGGPAEYNVPLCATMHLLKEAGWSLRPLGSILGYSQEAVRKMIRKHLAMSEQDRREVEDHLPVTIPHLVVTHGRRKPKKEESTA